MFKAFEFRNNAENVTIQNTTNIQDIWNDAENATIRNITNTQGI
jgi:hypothetical protein